jgi:hypothetical protein
MLPALGVPNISWARKYASTASTSGRRASGLDQIIDRLVVDAEKTHGRAVFRRHVADGGAIRHRKRRRALAEEFDEFADDLRLAQHLGDGKHQVGRGDAFVELALEMHADDVGGEEIHRLAEHAGLGFDAAPRPTRRRRCR